MNLIWTNASAEDRAALLRARKCRLKNTRYKRCVSLDDKLFYGFTEPCEPCNGLPWSGCISCFCEPVRCTLKQYWATIRTLYPAPKSKIPLSIPDMLRAGVSVSEIAEAHNIKPGQVKAMAANLRLDWTDEAPVSTVNP